MDITDSSNNRYLILYSIKRHPKAICYFINRADSILHLANADPMSVQLNACRQRNLFV